ncbi:hypothetical protein [Flavobacterium sp. WC2509]|uniref:hypothetical protein n=1 Tax=Flavobacterium sp. WC2509 TaxID=3461406 RepID=UPI0040444C46
MKHITVGSILLVLLLLTGCISTYGQNSGLLQIQDRKKSESKTITIEDLEKVKPIKGDYISVDFYNSLRIPDHHISVFISNLNEKGVQLKLKSEPPTGYKVEWSQSIIDTTFNISFSEYEKAIQLFRKISSSDIINENSNMGLVTDGTSCKIEFGYTTGSVSYFVWSPDYKTTERNLNQFLECFEYLQKLAKKKF